MFDHRVILLMASAVALLFYAVCVFLTVHGRKLRRRAGGPIGPDGRYAADGTLLSRAERQAVVLVQMDVYGCRDHGRSLDDSEDFALSPDDVGL